jgi:hypothetical protein
LKKSGKFLVAVLCVLICSIVFFGALISSYSLPVQDLAQYWAAAHLFPINPYSMELTRQFEQSASIFSTPLITKMPPWALTLVLPLSRFGYHVSFAVWTLMTVLILIGCTYRLGRDLYRNLSLEPAILPFLFGPTVVLLMLGQFTILVLLGVVLFGLLVRNGRDWLAGASLLLVIAKPHTPLLFLVAVALWIVREKRWVVLASGLLTFVASTAIAVAINPHIFGQFRQRSLLVVHETQPYPNVGGILYSISGLHIMALVPQIIGLIWVLFFWRKHRGSWRWEREGAFVLLVSVTCSYYSYPYDEILALPALISALATGNRRAFALPFLLTNCGYAVYLFNFAGHFGFGCMFLWWTALGWCTAAILARTSLFERGPGSQNSEFDNPSATA